MTGTSGDSTLTRRAYAKYGGAVLGGGLLAGCAGGTDSASTPVRELVPDSE